MIEPLPIVVTATDRLYRQLARKGIVALYEVRTKKHLLIGFELILIRYQPARKLDTFSFPEKERYPASSEFGRYGWSFPNSIRESAELAFDHLAAILDRKRSQFDKLSDYYRPWNKRADSDNYRQWLKPLVTGRPLPKSGRRTNAMAPPTEQLTKTTGKQDGTSQ